MRRRYESERRTWRERGPNPAASYDRSQDDRDGYGEYPGQFGGDYDDAERRFGAHHPYAEGERDTGGWAQRPQQYGQPRGGYGERGYGGYGGRAHEGPRAHRQPSRDRWEQSEYPGVPGETSHERLANRGFRGRGPRGYSRSDERIREEICELLTHEDIDVSDVEVLVSKGEVTLSGTVADRRTKREAENLVEEVSGVKDVSNQIRIRSESERDRENESNARGAKRMGENEQRPH